MTDARIIIAGDSNPLGFLNTGAAPYALTARVQIWADTNADGIGDAWHYMRPGVNTGTLNNPTAWGEEVQIANKWLGDHPTGIIWIVKGQETVKGGATAADSFDPHTGPMFASTTHAVNDAMHNLDGSAFAFSQFDVAFIGLGENDATNPTMAANYLANITEINAAARTAWHVDELVEYRITEGAGAPADNLAVRQAQWQADQADAHLVTYKTIGYDMQPDGVHYALAGHVALGNDAYDAWVF
jgi:hypothetical protein